MASVEKGKLSKANYETIQQNIQVESASVAHTFDSIVYREITLPLLSFLKPYASYHGDQVKNLIAPTTEPQNTLMHDFVPFQENALKIAAGKRWQVHLVDWKIIPLQILGAAFGAVIGFGGALVLSLILSAMLSSICKSERLVLTGIPAAFVLVRQFWSRVPNLLAESR